MLKFHNTYKSGRVSVIAFREANNYVGVCLEFNLIVRSNTLEKALDEIRDYTEGWLENVVKNKLPEKLLNKPAPKKYWDKFEKAVMKDMIRARAKRNSLPANQSVISNYDNYKPQTPLFV